MKKVAHMIEHCLAKPLLVRINNIFTLGEYLVAAYDT